MINKRESINAFFEAILTLKTQDQCYSFFGDVCTIRELQTFSNRFLVAIELLRGKTYREINAETGISEAIIARVKRSLDSGPQGIKQIMDRMETK